MKMIVCVKQVPDTEAKIRIAENKLDIESGSINYILNPYDEYAVEEALRIKEKQSEGSITVLSAGTERTASALRSALAMGADEAILIRTMHPIGDPLATARSLVEVLKTLPFDLLLFGKQAVDDDNQQVGPMVAQLLGLPCVTVVTQLSFEGNRVTARREIEGGSEIIETTLPAVFTAEKGLNIPRYPALRGIMMAKKKTIEEKQVRIETAITQIINLEYPPSRKGGRIVGKGMDAVPELITLLREEAKVI